MAKYGMHPSQELLKCFRERPYQGQLPEKAKVLILGNDANYDLNISTHLFFRYIVEYHKDSVAFWKKYATHHPFLLPDYPFSRNQGGVPYHAKFRKLGFDDTFSEYISFIELLNLPTTGNTGSNTEEFFNLMDKNHLLWIDDLIFDRNQKFVLINQTLAKRINQIMKRFGAPKRLASVVCDMKLFEKKVCPNGSVIYNGYSFSAAISDAYLKNLALEMRSFIAADRLESA